MVSKSVINNYKGHALRTVVGLLILSLYPCWVASAGNIPVQTAASDDVNITKVGHFGGATYAALPFGNYAYIGQGSDFVVLNISNKTAPVEVDRVETGGIIMDIALAGNYAYVADGSNGLLIVDVSNPAALTLNRNSPFFT